MATSLTGKISPAPRSRTSVSRRLAQPFGSRAGSPIACSPAAYREAPDRQRGRTLTTCTECPAAPRERTAARAARVSPSVTRTVMLMRRLRRSDPDALLDAPCSPPNGPCGLDASAPREPGAHAPEELVGAQARAEGHAERPLEQREALGVPEGVDVVALVAEAQDAPVLFGEISEKGRIEQQRVVAMVGDVLRLERNRRIVVGVEDRLAVLED